MPARSHVWAQRLTRVLTLCCFTRVQPLPERGATRVVARIRAVRIGRWIIIGLGTVVALCVLTVLAVTLFVDPNRFKGRIEAAVRTATGRPFEIAGDLDLAWFPWLAVQTGPAQLGNRQGDTVCTARAVAVRAHRCAADPVAARPAHHRRRAARRTEIPSASRRPGPRELGRPARASRPGRRIRGPDARDRRSRNPGRHAGVLSTSAAACAWRLRTGSSTSATGKPATKCRSARSSRSSSRT